jgi:hypothetical protein
LYERADLIAASSVAVKVKVDALRALDEVVEK